MTFPRAHKLYIGHSGEDRRAPDARSNAGRFVDQNLLEAERPILVAELPSHCVNAADILMNGLRQSVSPTEPILACVQQLPAMQAALALHR
jgi:hypothetical protein